VVDENSIDYELIVIAEIIKLPAKPVAYDLELGKSSLTIENGGFISINDYDPQITYSVRVSGGDFVGLDCEEDEFYIDSFGYLKTKYRNPCFSYAWDGGSKLTISFYRVR
ncbi:MAG: hypothetical protein FWG42_09105, partial [Clostridiales bacterium]|nr:hypothetical protein [Clostridiales bacterium]